MDHAPKIYRVSELNRLAKTILEDEIGTLCIEGEISGFHQSAQGHCYFTLKDEKAEIPAALFRGQLARLKVELKDGLLVHVEGEVTLYEARGRYQLICRTIKEAGEGALYEAFEKLKAKLEKEGLFDPERKKRLPLLPRHIGIVTSPTGAALQDILHIITRRFPNMRITIAPARVQGAEAAEEISNGINLLNRQADVIIIGRGGGSLEDLWAFNKESVARAIERSGIPVLSAVGHETDFTISDFVADQRAPTPSAAAELVVPRKQDIEETIAQLRVRLIKQMEGLVLHEQQHLRHALTQLVHGSRHHLHREQQRLDDISQKTVRHGEIKIRRLVQKIRGVEDRLRAQNPQARLRHNMLRVERAQALLIRVISERLQNGVQTIQRASLTLTHSAQHCLRANTREIDRFKTQLRILSPLSVLDRGFSITTDAAGKIISSARHVQAGDQLETILAEGRLLSTVTRTQEKRDHDRQEK